MTTIIKPAATVILMRDAEEGGFEILMVKRSSRSAFGSIYVFPGGKLDQEDSTPELYSYCKGMTDSEASRKLGIEKDGLAYWIACIRECFEEVGVLLTETNDSIIQDKFKLNALRDKLNNQSGTNTGDETSISIKDKYESNPNTNAFTDDEKNKLANLESSKFVGEYVRRKVGKTAAAA